ncbi:MAG: DUF4259 domain-containing protein [Acidimicrobiales bacterium]|nr:DUF4259 domain-containing protein [Acidimicrobiales bacterium]
MTITGPAPFEATEAVALADAVTTAGSLAPVEAAMQVVLEPGRIELADGVRALAAADIVAAVRGNPSAQLPAGVATWIAQASPVASSTAVAQAREVVSFVASDDSALCEEQAARFGAGWMAVLDDLSTRLA